MKSAAQRVAVLKFGGSSVGSAEAYRHVGGILLASRDAGNRTVGVLSAMFGVTNRLIDAANHAIKHDKVAVSKIRGDLLDAHVATAKDLCNPQIAEEAADYIHSTMTTYFDDVTREISGKATFTPYDQDRLSSVGERWSTRIMAAYLQSIGHDAPFVESTRIIVTDEQSGNAKPILDATRARTDTILQPMLARNAIPLVTGFFGASQVEGKLTTLGRGGSDLTAAVLGYCLDATEVSLYKVEYTTRPDGWMDTWSRGWVGVVHDADPSTTIESLSYEEARELAHFAKKVLHPETVSPAVEKDIPIAVRNTFDPRHPGTRIAAARFASSATSSSGVGASSSSSSSSSSHNNNHSSSSSSSSHTNSAAVVGVVARSALARPVEARVQTITKVSLKAYEAKNTPLRDLDLSALRVKREESALVVMVGLQVMAVPDIEARVTKTLRDAGIPVYVPKHVNGSENNFSMIVPETRRNEAVDILHKTYVVNNAWQNLLSASGEGESGNSNNSNGSSSRGGNSNGSNAKKIVGHSNSISRSSSSSNNSNNNRGVGKEKKDTTVLAAAQYVSAAQKAAAVAAAAAAAAVVA